MILSYGSKQDTLMCDKLTNLKGMKVLLDKSSTLYTLHTVYESDKPFLTESLATGSKLVAVETRFRLAVNKIVVNLKK